jgi:hypothetical protein
VPGNKITRAVASEGSTFQLTIQLISIAPLTILASCGFDGPFGTIQMAWAASTWEGTGVRDTHKRTRIRAARKRGGGFISCGSTARGLHRLRPTRRVGQVVADEQRDLRPT